MPRADLLIDIVRAATRGDQPVFRQALEALIAEERKKQHHVLADRLAEMLKANGAPPQRPLAAPDERPLNLFYELSPKRKFDELLLPATVRSSCDQLAEEHRRRDLLHSYGLEARHRILLAGPPGNGKTSLSEAIAEALMVPLVVVRYEGVIGSYLGETANRLRRLFDYVRGRECVLFFDEFDTLGKERGDIHETGEIKRVVSSLLLQIDDLPDHVVVVTATNHPELLDRAVWRRFQVRLFLPPPTRKQAEEWFRRFQDRTDESLGRSLPALAQELRGLSFSELEDFSTDILRRRVLQLPGGDLRAIVADCLAQWRARFKPSRSRVSKDA